MNARHYTSLLLEMIDDGLLDSNSVINACLSYMSEFDVHDMMRCNEFLPEEEEEDSDDE